MFCLPSFSLWSSSRSSWLRFLLGFACGEERGRFPQSRRRPDFVKPLMHLKCRQLLAVQQILVHLGEIASLVGRKVCEGLSAEDSKSVIDVAHAGSPVLLAVCENLSSVELALVERARVELAFFELDIAGVPLPFVAEDCHHSQHSSRLELVCDGCVVAGKIGITVHDKERVA